MENDEITADLEQLDTQDQEDNNQDNNQDYSQNQDLKSEEDDKDWKAEALKYKAILDRNKNKTITKEPSKTSNDLGYDVKAFLTANGLKGSDEYKLAQDFAKNTGKTYDQVVENKYFLQELEEYREIKKTGNSAPKSRGKTSNMSQDSIEFWLAKPFGELPDDFELRKKVVNARRQKSRNTGMFTPD